MTSVAFFMVIRQHNEPIVLLAGGVDGLVVARRPRLRDRLAARLRARRLDRALAEGTPPEASAALALRAHQLTESEQRGSIAQAIRRVVREGHAGARPTLGRVMPSWPR